MSHGKSTSLPVTAHMTRTGTNCIKTNLKLFEFKCVCFFSFSSSSLAGCWIFIWMWCVCRNRRRRGLRSCLPLWLCDCESDGWKGWATMVIGAAAHLHEYLYNVLRVAGRGWMWIQTTDAYFNLHHSYNERKRQQIKEKSAFSLAMCFVVQNVFEQSVFVFAGTITAGNNSRN